MKTSTPLPLGSVNATINRISVDQRYKSEKYIRSIALSFSVILATSTSLFGATWDGGGADNEYSTALNWSDDLVPTSSTTQDISGAYTVDRTVNSSSGRTFVQNGAVLNVTSGDHDDSQSGNTIRNFVGNGSTGTVNMSGASTTYDIGHVLAIAHSSNSNGAFYHTDGALNVYRGGNSLIGGYAGIFGRGHSISIGGNDTHTNVSGLYEISGGSLSTRVGVAVGNNGTFSIVGSSATEIRLGGSGDDTGWFALSSDGTLKAAIDVGGITPIYVEDRTNTSTITPEVELQAGALLDLSFIGSPINGTWTLIEVENADIVDNGLALAPGVDSNWSFAIDNSGTNGLLTVNYQNGGRNSVTVTSLAQLVLYMDDSYTDLVMAPGTYQIGPDDVTSGLLDDGDTYLLHFSGNDSTFDFTGVKFEIDTYVYRSFGNNEVRAIEITGQDLVLSNLTMEDIGTARPGNTALAVKLNGWRNLVEGFTITIRGSVPYGYGDIFGKGAGSVIGHKKHSGILIAGDDNTLRNATLYHRAYGHGIFVQGAINTLIEGCYVEGELSTTDRVLAEAGTGSRADNVAFQTVWGFPLRAGNTFSLQEDGIRTYNTGTDQTGTERHTANITVRDCTIYRMRSGVTIGFTNGTQYVENCVAIQCENAYWIQNGDLINSAADSQVGIVLNSPYGNSGTKNVDLTIVKNDNEGGEDNRMLAYIAGPNDNITFRSSNANVNQNIKLVVGGPRDSHRYELTDTGLSAGPGVIHNLTNYPVELSSISSNITGSSWGAVTDNGSSNNLTSASNNVCGGFSMMQTIQAEDYCTQSGTSDLPTNNGGTSVGDIQDGDWLRFDDVFFGSGPKYIEALVAGGTNGGSIEVRLDSTTGTLLGTLNANGSAIPENWVTETAAITHTQGIHNVYLVFKGGAGDLLELDHFKFTERNNDPYDRDSYNLIAHYKFDEGTGSTATDATGNGYDGTISSATWTTGAEQGALAFDGSSSTVDIPAVLFDNMEEEITVSLWVYGDNTQPLDGSVFYAQSSGGDRILNAHLPYSNSNIYWDAGDSGGYGRLQKLASASQFQGQWNHWTFVKNTTQSDMLIYHNGELFAASQSDSTVIGDAIIASIGSRLGGNNYFGSIDDVKFYNAALSRNEIKEQYENYFINQAPGFIADPITKSNAASGITYADTINNSALDPDGDTLTYSKLSGPAWLNVATDGSLSGTPDSGDIGLNAFTVQVDAIGGSDTATLNITVDVGTYTLTYTAGANGSISGTSPQVVGSGTSGSAVTAVADVGYSFVNWSDSSTDNPRTDVNVTNDVTVTANFQVIPNKDAFATIEGEDYDDQSGVSTQPSSEGGLNVQNIQNGDWAAYYNVDFGSGANEFRARVASNTSGGNIEVRLDSPTGTLLGTSIVPGTGGWQTWTTVTTSISNVSGLHNVFLVFTGGGGYLFNVNWFTFASTYTLTYTAGANGSITGTNPQTVDSGANGSAVTAVAATNYHFVNWSDSSTANPRTDIAVTSDVTVTANFAIDTYAVDYTAGSNGSITGSASQTIDHGSDATQVEAVPATNYHFVNWSDSSTANPRTDTNVTAAIAVTANFAIDTYAVDYTAGSNGSITGNTSQTIDHGSDATQVEAVPATNYHFVNWSDSSTANPRTDTNVTAAIAVTANFAIDTYAVDYTAGSNGSITGNTSQTIDHGSDATQVEAVPATNYHFVNWSDSSTANPRTDTNVTAAIAVTANFAIDTYAVDYTAGSNGSITGSTSQTIDHGSDATQVEAVPATNYHFVNWSDSSTANPRTDTNVTAAIAVTANFAIDTYAVDYTAGSNGSITGPTSQTIDHGSDATQVEAVPATNYHFVNWSDSSTANPRTDTNVTAAIAVTANFAIDTYAVDYTAGSNGSITGNTSQTIDHGSDATQVTAVPASNHHFVDWSDGSTDNPRTDLNVTSDITVTANFTIDTYTLTYTAGANGSITGTTPQTIDHGSDGSAVSAVANANYSFVNWSDGSTDNPRTDLSVTADVTVTANFTIDTYTLTYTAGANGSITGTTPQTIDHGDNGSAVTAVADTNYHFVDWSDGSTDNPRTDLSVTADVTVTANFTIDTYTLTYTAGANGSITGTTPQTIDHGSDGSAVSAVANANYSFVNWSDGSTDNPRTDLSVTADVTVTANFTIDTYTLTYTASANGSITGSNPQTIDHGDNGSAVTAVADTNYSFVDWSDGSTDNPRTDLSVTDDVTVTANFTIDTYTLTYTAGANGSITGTTPQTIDHGDNGTTVTAVAAANYSFVDWSDSSTANPRTDLSVTADINVTANFELSHSELENWRFTHFGSYDNTGTAADDFDADLDGILNLIEYATGTDPNSPSVASFTIQPSAGSGLEVSFDRIDDSSLSYSVEGTNSLLSPTWAPIWSGSGSSAGEVIIPDTNWPNETNYFLRLNVSY